MNTIEPTSLVLWHASRADVPRPTIDGRTIGDNHDNSGLGLYCSTVPDQYITNFGEFIYEIKLRPDLRVLRLPLSELVRMSSDAARDRSWFENYGKKLAKDYDIIDIEEFDGWVARSIILRDEAVVNVRRYTADEFKAKCRRTSSPGFART